MKKVILLAPLPPPMGGIAAWANRMLHTKLKNNWSVAVVDEKVIGGREVFGEQSKRSLGLELKRCYKIWSNLHKELKSSDAKVVHSCIPAGTLSISREYVCACITKVHRKKFIVHFRCTVPNMVKSKVNYYVLKLLCNKCDHILALNQKSEDFIKACTKVDVSTIPNFISKEEVVLNHVISKDIKRAIYVGGTIVEKGCADIITVAKQLPNIEFLMIGKASSEIKEMAKNVKNVRLMPPISRDKVKTELGQADVFMFLSHFPGEGFSNALTEAMAAGMPCIVTDWAANADMIDNKRGGIVVPVGDTAQVVTAIEKMKSEDIRRSYAQYNIDKVKKQYIENVVVDQYVDVYEKVIG